MEGKVVIVTGAGGALGRATSLLTAREGARVFANDLGCTIHGEGQSSAPAEETVRLVREAGGEAIASADRVAQMIVFLAFDLARNVNGQLFYVRGNEIFFIQPCQATIRLADENWTPRKIAEVAMPQFEQSFGTLRGEDENIIYESKMG